MDVWQLPELVRHIVSFSSQACNALMVSRATVQDPCTTVYREWARSGCAENHHCLHGLGKDSLFCVGSFDVSVPGELLFDMDEDLEVVRKRVGKVLTTPLKPSHVLTVDFTFKQTLIRVLREAGAYEVIVITNGWRRRGNRCRLQEQDGQHFIYKMLSTYGTISTPCPQDSQSYRTLTIGKKLGVDISVVTDGRVWQLLSASRH
jgi:hypothetical protein